MGKKRWILLGLVLLILPLVEAIGIEGPMLGIVVYEPGKEINVNYLVYNYQGEADLKISGKLADLATITHLEEEEGKKYFKIGYKIFGLKVFCLKS